MSAKRLLLPGLVLLLGSCRSAELASANLDELMTPTHTFRYSGRVRTGFDYLLESVIDPDWLNEDSLASRNRVKPIKNPTKLALANLLALRKDSFGMRGTFLDAERVRQYVRYAAFCPSALCRERAFLEMAPHARRLGAEEVVTPQQPANEVEVLEGLRGLRGVLVVLATNRGRLDETTRQDFEAACQVLQGLELDLEGGRRLLRIIAAFGQLPGLEVEELGPLVVLSESVQRRVISLALTEGRYDSSGLVRAAALRANHAAFGDAFLDEALIALASRVRTNDEGRLLTTGRFRLVPEGGREIEPYVAVFELLQARGLPPVSGKPSERIDRRLKQLQALMQITHDFSTYPDRTRVLAMQTLSHVSPAGLDSLREEDWAQWWSAYSVTELARLERAQEVEQDGGNGGGNDGV